MSLSNPIPLTDVDTEKKFRNFVEITDKIDPIAARVYNTYLSMHTHQCVDYVKQRYDVWLKFNHAQMSVYDALEQLSTIVDESDPDVDVPNVYHAFQTAESIRKQYPNDDWFHLVGLIHDVGKIMALYGEPQWSTVGDTFPVGCRFSDEIVYSSTTFKDNPDIKKPLYSSQYGIYTPNCGLENVMMSWGHDEYLYRVLKNHQQCTLPDEAFYIIRYHSFYPWHTNGAYMYLCNEKDLQMLKLVQKFQKFDLYTKDDEALPDLDELKGYYQNLIKKYIPGVLSW
ncbi:unnamed protein product [Didymodactylos carnosus]|uniref:Inositol oxygenase n=1 Tax=Didymodactylos carnosus TaxID=1234261 RepID=A0A813V4I6_9BILA|nr:unnamed protein product [Didymodactylos carnosus]CAF0836560.1 unnamed protein product [Didymodactylos carnosus]CAF3585601.1 unnamed protein product [Didymodactylos carnosus]CAF3623793.1 unnamed protein product [Didymodactylos carnosus]